MKNRLGIPIKDITAYCLMIVGIVYFIYRGTENQGYFWQWFRVPQYFFTWENGIFKSGILIQGLLMTLHISWISLILTYIVGLVTALIRLSDSKIGKIIARLYLELIRNTPLLVQLFFIYFVIAPVLGIDRFWSAVLSLSLFEGAYASEIYRSGIVSLPKGQWEAAHSLGLNIFDTYRKIILPQAIRRVLPPLTSQAISLIKDSSLVSVIAVYELTMQANAIVAETFLTFEIYFSIALVYLILTIILSQFVGFMERKFSVLQ
jgi:polar amino acid transport system permease protein